MSVKIYYGLRATAPSPWRIAEQVREALYPLFAEKIQQLAEVIKHMEATKEGNPEEYKRLKSSLLGGEKLPWRNHPRRQYLPPLYKAFMVVEALREIEVHTFSPFDFWFEVLLFENRAGGNPLLMIYSEDGAYRARLLEAGIAEEYGYWDNADPEEDLSEAEWEERKLAWSGLTGNWAPNSLGLAISPPSRIDVEVSRHHEDYWKFAQEEAARA